jgi:hypothetical protein
MLAAAENNFITITDEESYNEAADFTNTYEININEHGKSSVSKCQAVRLDKSWFITAAHCIEPICDKVCSMQARLVVGPNYEMGITTTHTTATPKVFKNARAKVAQKNAAYDIALLYFPPKDSKFIFKDPSRNMWISEKTFLNRIPNFNVYHRAANGTNIPPILAINSKTHKMLRRSISVVSIWDGKRAVLNTKKPVFYSPKMHYLYTENFGIRQGISGSGVMTNTGELVAIVSAIGSLDKFGPNGKETIPIAFLASFDRYILDFIKEYVGRVEYKMADDTFIRNVPAKYSSLVDGVDRS